MSADVVIAGAGQAAAQLALSLRSRGFAGSIAMIGEEPHPPYERPPLSKDYLAGKREAAKLFLRKPEAWAERQVQLMTGQRVQSVSPETKQVKLADGSAVGYGWLVWATGGRPRPLPVPGANLAGVHVIRGIADIDGLKQDLGSPRRTVIIGGGYIGLEAAAVLRSLGHSVTLVEALPRLLARVTSGIVSQFFLDLHRNHGVEIHLGAAVSALCGKTRVEGVALASGDIIPADLVIVGIGIQPNIEPLADAGLPCPNGVAIDEHCRTKDPHILAIGDCALHPSRYAGQPIRLESVQNAVDQAKTACETILGSPVPYAALPWFWSDQYDVKMQSLGLQAGCDQIVTRGDPVRGPFSVAYLRENRLIALDCLNAPRDFIQGKPLIASGAVIDAGRLADAAVDLKLLGLSAEPPRD